MVTKLLHTRFRVSNLEKSIHFYTNTFNLALKGKKISPRGSKIAFLKVPKSEELLELAEYNESGPIDITGKDLVHIALEIKSFDEFTKHLKSLGIEYSEAPSGNIAFVDDPDGYEIELVQKSD